MDKIEKKIAGLIKPYIKKEGLKLYKVDVNDSRRNGAVKIFVDNIDNEKNHGIEVESLQKLNRFVGDILDAEDLIKNSYILEVSSPGLAELEDKYDYDFFKGRYVKIVHSKGEDFGYIKGFEEDTVIIETKDNKEVKIKNKNIRKSNLYIEK